MFFCFRWMLIFFKREFSFDSTSSVWEAVLSTPVPAHGAVLCVRDGGGVARRDPRKQLHLDELMLLMNTLAGTRCTTPLIARCAALYNTFTERAFADPEIHAFVEGRLHTLSDAVVLDLDNPRPRAASATVPMTRDPTAGASDADTPVAPGTPVAPPVYNAH